MPLACDFRTASKNIDGGFRTKTKLIIKSVSLGLRDENTFLPMVCLGSERRIISETNGAFLGFRLFFQIQFVSLRLRDIIA